MSTPSPRRSRGGGGRGGVEPRARIQQRERDAWEMDIRGCSQRAIAEHLGVSQPAVSKILQRVAARLASTLAADARRHHLRMQARVEYLIGEALQAWHRSQTDHTRRRQRRVGGRGSATAQEVTEITITTRVGDPRFLRTANDLQLAALQIGRALAATEPTPPAWDLAGLTEEELGVLERAAARPRTARAPQPAGPGRGDEADPL